MAKKENKTTIHDRTVVWKWDESIKNASLFPADNLYILDADGSVVWNMRDTLGHEDVCVDLRAVDDSCIRFTTMTGLGIVINVQTLDIVSRQVVK